MASDSSQEPDLPQDESFASRLTRKYGEGVDPEVSLGGEVAEAPSGATSELLKRLAEHGVKSPRYKLEGEVARGGMGAILKIWDEDLRRHLAMKVVLGRGDAASTGGTPQLDTKVLARFLEEAQVTGQLDHPGIVPVHELGLDQDGHVYFTMKLVKGRDLKAIFDLVFQEKEGWNETRALGVILKACEAMAYAHAKGVIHRDLKPANIMVGGFGEVFVMDWGLARVLGREDSHDIRIFPEAEGASARQTSVRTERSEVRKAAPYSPLYTMDGDVMGTPAYMPPEQARGEIEKLSARSDVYSLGAMLYHLLARQVPYERPGEIQNGLDALRAVHQGAPAPLRELRRGVPAELEAICDKAMARDAAQRYTDTLELAEDLRAFLEGRVVKAYQTGAIVELHKWVQRNKSLAAALAGAAAILVLGIVTSTTFATRATTKAKEADDARLETAAKNRDLSAATKLARDEEQLATQKTNDVLSLSAIQELIDLEVRADALWPTDPEQVPKYEAWLSEARVLIEGQPADPAKGLKKRPSLAEHEAKLGEIRARAKPLSAERVEGDASERRIYEFEDGEDRWWHAQLSKLVSDLKSFTDEKAGGLYSSGTSEKHGWGIVKRVEFARTIRESSVDGPEAKRRWDEAIAAIAASPKYGGLKLRPQLGLLPISADPESGLWEFVHLATGQPAERGSDGKLILKESMGLVFVLIPGGAFRMGAQSADPNAPNYDPQSRSEKTPVHEVTLSPYFLSKYEMTQGQWERFTGRNPSAFGPDEKLAGHQHNLLHPVEQVSWAQCTEVIGRLGLSLPSEAQWECGCRGGTETAWWTGGERESLRGKVNLADQTAKKSGANWSDIQDWQDLDDGWVAHAPVGSFPANPFGLHETHGNVWEWCQDGYDASFYERSPAIDPVAPIAGASNRVLRGGSFNDAASYARSAYRSSNTPEFQFDVLGLRPARALQLSARPVQPEGK